MLQNHWALQSHKLPWSTGCSYGCMPPISQPAENIWKLENFHRPQHRKRHEDVLCKLPTGKSSKHQVHRSRQWQELLNKNWWRTLWRPRTFHQNQSAQENHSPVQDGRASSDSSRNVRLACKENRHTSTSCWVFAFSKHSCSFGLRNKNRFEGHATSALLDFQLLQLDLHLGWSHSLSCHYQWEH